MSRGCHDVSRPRRHHTAAGRGGGRHGRGTVGPAGQSDREPSSGATGPAPARGIARRGGGRARARSRRHHLHVRGHGVGQPGGARHVGRRADSAGAGRPTHSLGGEFGRWSTLPCASRAGPPRARSGCAGANWRSTTTGWSTWRGWRRRSTRPRRWWPSCWPTTRPAWCSRWARSSRRCAPGVTRRGVFTDAVQAATFMDLAACDRRRRPRRAQRPQGGWTGRGRGAGRGCRHRPRRAARRRRPGTGAAQRHPGRGRGGRSGHGPAPDRGRTTRGVVPGRRVARPVGGGAPALGGRDPPHGRRRRWPPCPGHLHLCFAGIEREELLLALSERGICASGGSSCASGALEPSYVLAAMGMPDALARGAIRFTLGHDTSEADIERALAVVPPVIAALRHDP